MNLITFFKKYNFFCLCNTVNRCSAVGCLDQIFIKCGAAVGCLHFKCSASFGPSHIVRLNLNMIYMECLGVINFRKSLCTPHVSKFLFSKCHLLPCVNRRSACNLWPRIVILWVEFKIFLDAVGRSFSQPEIFLNYFIVPWPHIL